jgi:hypothetical protein
MKTFICCSCIVVYSTRIIILLLFEISNIKTKQKYLFLTYLSQNPFSAVIIFVKDLLWTLLFKVIIDSIMKFSIREYYIYKHGFTHPTKRQNTCTLIIKYILK